MEGTGEEEIKISPVEDFLLHEPRLMTDQILNQILFTQEGKAKLMQFPHPIFCLFVYSLSVLAPAAWSAIPRNKTAVQNLQSIFTVCYGYAKRLIERERPVFDDAKWKWDNYFKNNRQPSELGITFADAYVRPDDYLDMGVYKIASHHYWHLPKANLAKNEFEKRSIRFAHNLGRLLKYSASHGQVEVIEEEKRRPNVIARISPVFQNVPSPSIIQGQGGGEEEKKQPPAPKTNNKLLWFGGLGFAGLIASVLLWRNYQKRPSKNKNKK